LAGPALRRVAIDLASPRAPGVAPGRERALLCRIIRPTGSPGKAPCGRRRESRGCRPQSPKEAAVSD
jgi:hypothetical protein